MRLLHTMLRVGDLDRSIKFYTELLGMKLLRREDYPDGKFTLAFVGYEAESTGTVIELTHNWDTPSYDLGNGFGHLALEFGAQGLTIHPRPDERHIRASDVPMLAELLKPHRPAIEFNIEGYPDDRLFGLLQQVTPEQTTLVPDAPDAFTSDQGWQLDDRQMALVKPYIARVKALGDRRIPTTAIVVQTLAEDWLVELEIIAMA